MTHDARRAACRTSASAPRPSCPAFHHDDFLLTMMWACALLLLLCGGGVVRGTHHSVGLALAPEGVYYTQTTGHDGRPLVSVFAPGVQLNGTLLSSTSTGSSLACATACLEQATPQAACSHFNYEECGAAQVGSGAWGRRRCRSCRRSPAASHHAQTFSCPAERLHRLPPLRAGLRQRCAVGGRVV